VARRVLALVLLGIAIVVCTALAASESLRNRTGSTATAVTVTFSEKVTITGYNSSVFTTQEPTGKAEAFRFSGGQLEDGGRFMISWSPSDAEITNTKWEIPAAPAAAGPLTYEEIMAQIAHYPGPDEPLYVPAENEQIWLTDLEGHADIYDNDSIKVNYAPGFDKSQITRIDVYRNGVKMRFVPALFDVLTNEQMKTFDGNPAENTPKSSHTNHAIWGYEYEVRTIGGVALPARAVTVRSPVHFGGEALAFIGHNFYDWLYLSDSTLIQSLVTLKAAGFTGISLGLNYYMDTPAAVDMQPWYTPDPAIFDTWLRTPTVSEVERTLRLAKEASMSCELRIEIQVAAQAQVWRGDITPRSVSAWFSNYQSLCLDLGRLAQREGVKRFVIGAELNSLEQYAQSWRNLAAAVRTVFFGEITFAQCAAIYLERDYSRRAPFEGSVGTFWDTFDLIEMNMWPGAGDGMRLETQQDQRFSVLVANLVHFWSKAFSYYREKYPTLPIHFGEIGTFDYDGAIVTGDFYGAWALPSARLDHQEYVDTWAAYFAMAAALGADGLGAWTFTLDPGTPQWIRTHQVNRTPAMRTATAVLSAAE
jgi:hypothetical protein